MLNIISHEEDANLDNEIPLHSLEMTKMKWQIKQSVWAAFFWVVVFFPVQQATMALLLEVQSVMTTL